MIKVWSAVIVVLLAFQASAAELNAENLQLSAEQNAKLVEMKEKLKAEIDPIWEEIESGKKRIVEIEKKYFEEFWTMLSDEQKQKFAELQK
ncbi:MAG: hypothetical protein J6B00_01960 [Alphaproteobacteria bacterium]|nr:hypothetical protein [Alphaproteobacteria bacterium]MBO5441051.1 hypothetical protein [Alphaproteobacteria bacterium]